MQGLKIAVYADGADQGEMLKRARERKVQGFTTNPTLMAKAGVGDYEAFARSILTEIRELPISFEVFSDAFDEMERQALKIAGWGPNVNVKIPITNTRREPALPLIRRLLDRGLKLNVTAICTEAQVNGLREILKPEDDVIVSIFAGRIADTGVDPIAIVSRAVHAYRDLPKAKILWASPREVLNAYQAEACGAHIITMTDALIDKLTLRGKSLEDYSAETVQMFYQDARRSGFQL